MGNLYLTTLDLARIGALVLNKGQWQGRQIVSEKWLEEMTKPRMKISPPNPFSETYGFFWYNTTKRVGDRSCRCYFASGNGGNVLFVVPDVNLVVALTSTAYGQGYGHQRSHNIFQYVLKALK